MNKQVLRIGAAVFTTVLLLALLWRFRIVVVYLVLSLALAAALRPLVDNLSGKPRPIRLAWVFAYLAAVAGIGFALFLLGVRAITEIQRLAQVLSVQQQWGLPLQLGGGMFPGALIARLPTPNSLFQAILANLQNTVLPQVLGLTEGLVGAITGIVITLFLSIYWIAGQDHFERLWLSVLPSARRKQARRIWRSVEPAIGRYIRGQVAQSVLFGILLGLGFWALGSRFPALLAIFGAVARLVPVAGVAAALVLTFLVGFLASGQLGILMFLFLLLIVVGLELWIKPRYFPNRWHNPILTLVIILALSEVLGVLGLIIAPPLAALTQILWHYLVSRRPETGAVTQISELKAREQRLRQHIEALDEPAPPVVTSNLEQLGRLLERAEPVLQAAFAESNEPSQPLTPQPHPPVV